MDKNQPDDYSIKNETIYKDETDLHKTGSGGSPEIKMGEVQRNTDGSMMLSQTERETLQEIGDNSQRLSKNISVMDQASKIKGGI